MMEAEPKGANFMNVTITGPNGASATINTLGAELKSFISGGCDYIWNSDPKYWTGSSPFLFPIASNVRDHHVLIDGKSYYLLPHGFAKNNEWTLKEQTETTAAFTFSQTEETLEHYPFAFTMEATYAIREDGLRMTMVIRNDSQGQMPYCFGTHPAFRVPFQNSPESAFTDYSIHFEKPEENSCPIYDNAHGQIDVSNRESFLSDPQTLPLRYEDYDRVDTIIFDHLNSAWTELRDNRTGRSLRLSFDHFDYIAFWTPHAPFICIEPWQGLSVCSDEGDDFRKKRGVKTLSPGESDTYTLDIAINAAK